MSNLHVSRGQTARIDIVDGTLELGNNATLEANADKKIMVKGGVFLEGKAYVNGNLECEFLESRVFLSKHKEISSGSNRARLDLTGKYVGKLEVNGNLIVHKQLNVSHSVQVKGLIDALDIDVGGKIEAGDIHCRRIRVGGRADIQNVFEAASVDVGGKVVAPGTVKIGDLNVGGEIEIGGGTITGNIRVGGKFNGKSTLEFGELLVYGKGNLPGGCTGRKVTTFGKLEVSGDLTCGLIEVGGVIEIAGNCHSKHVEIGGKLGVNKSLFVSDKLEGYGSIEIGEDLESTHLRLSGKLEANKIIVIEEADISGKLETEKGLKAKLVIVRSGSRCKGPLVGEQVEIGKSSDLSYGNWGGNWIARWTTAKVDDIYAIDAVIGPNSKAGKIFAATIKLEHGATAEQVTYSKEFNIDFNGSVNEPPIKVSDLPKPPL